MSTIVQAGSLERLTNNRETDARTALTRGLAEYLRTLSVVMLNGRDIRFEKVYELFSQPEVPAKYPSAIVYASQPGTYDASRFTPQTFNLGSGITVRAVSEFVQSIDLEVWATDPKERMALVAMIEDAFNPVDWMTGFFLDLPHYHNARATYELVSMTYLDSGEDNQRGWCKAAFSINANVRQLRSLNTQLPDLKTRLDVRVDREEPEEG